MKAILLSRNGLYLLRYVHSNSLDHSRAWVKSQTIPKPSQSFRRYKIVPPLSVMIHYTACYDTTILLSVQGCTNSLWIFRTRSATSLRLHKWPAFQNLGISLRSATKFPDNFTDLIFLLHLLAHRLVAGNRPDITCFLALLFHDSD